MIKSIELQGRAVDYTLKVSSRARRLRLAIHRNGDFVVTVPRFANNTSVERFINLKSEWVLKMLDKFKELRSIYPVAHIGSSNRDYHKHRDTALEIVKKKVGEFNKQYNFSYNKITVRNQKTRWGSCSRKGNLNFNYKIATLPEKLADYIVVHEICHLGEFNHSRQFWNLVEKAIPNHKEIRLELKKIGRIY